MKAIVANVLLGSILGCLCWTNSTVAVPLGEQPHRPLLKSRVSISPTDSQTNLAVKLPVNLLGHALKVEQAQPSRLVPSIISDRVGFSNLPYVHRTEQNNFVLGFQNTFWPSSDGGKYWGVTTVEHWGKNNYRQLELSKLNYVNSAPMLASGSSSLTFSGGGNSDLTNQKQLARDNYNSPEFEEFRGGVTYHRGIARQVTMGVGFVYEKNIAGFTQLTYDSDILPIETTISLLAKDSTVNLHSHVRFQPAHNFVLDYYNDSEKQQYNLNWAIAPEFTLISKGNSEHKSYSAGVKIAFKNDYWAFSATAQLDNEHNLQWKINSQFGGFQFVYRSDRFKSNSELNVNLIDSQKLSWQCSTFVNYKTQFKPARDESEDFITGGARIQSRDRIGGGLPLWSLDLGYGRGIYGKGAILSGSVALKSNLLLKLNYQTISAVSDDTKIKLELSSR